MMRGWRFSALPACALVAAIMVAEFPPVPPAMAAANGVPGWRVVATVGSKTAPAQMMAVTAISPNNAWAFGRIQGTPCTPGCPSSLLVRHWNGRAWRAVRLPTSVRHQWPADLPMAAGASSADNVWVFGTYRWARWNGRRWTSGTMPRIGVSSGLIFSTVVLGPDNVWALGQTGSASADSYIAHFNGVRWRAASLSPYYPGITAVSAVSRRDIWASSANVTDAVLHWDGHSWHPVAVPSRFVNVDSSLAGLVALSADSIWITGSVRSSSGGTSVPGALHWNRSTGSWSIYRLRTKAPLIDATPDGHGGLWAVAQGGITALRFWHWAAGRWSSASVPDSGVSAFIGGFAAAPGTSSMWAVGVSRIDGSLRGSILLHGRVPR